MFPWTRSTRLIPQVPTTGQTVSSIADFAGGAIILIAAIWIAHYNWKAGRGDLRGASRVGIYCGAMSLIAWTLGAHHVAAQQEQDLIKDALGNSAFILVAYWLCYLALEPWVRRYWPQTLITWSRVLAGRWRDPMVGRDVLFGVLFGLVYLGVFIGQRAHARGLAPQIGARVLALTGTMHARPGAEGSGPDDRRPVRYVERERIVDLGRGRVVDGKSANRRRRELRHGWHIAERRELDPPGKRFEHEAIEVIVVGRGNGAALVT